MNAYEKLIADYEAEDIRIFEMEFKAQSNGYCKGKDIIIRNSLDTTTKHCVLAEELGHYYTTTGEIYRQDTVTYIKEELKGRRWAYERAVPFQRLLDIVKTGYECVYEIAEFFNVTEQFLIDAILYYQSKFGENFYEIHRQSV